MIRFSRLRCLWDAYVRESRVWDSIVAEAETELRAANTTVYTVRDLFELAGRVEQFAAKIERVADRLLARAA